MTALAANLPRGFVLGPTQFNDLEVVAGGVIFEGSAVGDAGAGFVRALQAADPFRGFALRKADNANGANGGKTVRLQHDGRVELDIGSLVVADIGQPVYASDDNTFTLTAAGNSKIGTVYRFVSSGRGVVEFDGATA